MFVALLLLALQNDSIANLDSLAKSRDIKALEAYCTPQSAGKLGFLKTNGTYGTGRFGWNVQKLNSPDGKAYVVFSTKITSEDSGEELFEWVDDKLGQHIEEKDNFGIKVGHHGFDLSFDCPQKTLNAVDKVTFEKVGRVSENFFIRMSPQFRVSQAQDTAGKDVPFVQAGGIVSIPVGSSNVFDYTFTYSGVVNLPGYAASINDREIMLTNDYWYPMIARNAATYDLQATVPSGWELVAQGTAAVAQPGKKAFHMGLPVVYFSLSAGPFRVATKVMGGRTYSSWSPSLSQEELEIQNELNRNVIEFYDSTFSKYPFPRWGSMVTPLYGGGALEAYSFATYGTGWLPDEDPHEPAHTWWGGIIPNTYLKSLWNESFAVFSEGLYNRENPTGNKVERRKAFIQDAIPDSSFDAAPCSNAPPSIGDAASSLGYGKGGYVLQMLEAEVGTEMMIRTCREWLNTHKPGETGEWEDYEKVVDRVTGKSYKWFFDQWINKAGWLDFSVQNLKWTGGKLRGDVKFNKGAYRFSSEILLDGPSSSEVKVARIGVDGHFEVSCPKKPKLVTFDPWQRLLRTRSGEKTARLLDAGSQMKVWIEMDRATWQPHIGRDKVAAMPTQLDNMILVGSPETSPKLKPLFEKAGLKVKGTKLTYDGTTIDLNKGQAMALIDLPNGKQCIVCAGKSRLSASCGRARLCLVDSLGRVLRAKTEPNRRGSLSFRL